MKKNSFFHKRAIILILLVVLLVMSAFLFYLLIKKDQFAPGKDSSTEDTNTGDDSGDQKRSTEVSGGEELEKRSRHRFLKCLLKRKYISFSS